MSALRANWTFWAAVVLLVALAPILILVPAPLTVWLLLADFVVAIILVCVWVEQRERKGQKSLPVILVKKKDEESE